MWIREGAFLVFTFMAGAGISCGYVAFITLLGVFEKLSDKYKMANNTKLIEWLIITGVSFGNLFFLLNRSLPFESLKVMNILYMLFNLFGGIFLGCLAGALAETLSIFPIFSRRFNIRKYLPYVLIAAALGKIFGAYVELVILH
jgi:stage V sporulation protein AB